MYRCFLFSDLSLRIHCWTGSVFFPQSVLYLVHFNTILGNQYTNLYCYRCVVFLQSILYLVHFIIVSGERYINSNFEKRSSSRRHSPHSRAMYRLRHVRRILSTCGSSSNIIPWACPLIKLRTSLPITKTSDTYRPRILEANAENKQQEY